MRHRIEAIDLLREDDHPRTIQWDDETGTVMGSHSAVPNLTRHLLATLPLEFGDVPGSLTLRDPRHDAADFLALLYLQVRSRDVVLPETLDSVEATPVGSRRTRAGGSGLAGRGAALTRRHPRPRTTPASAADPPTRRESNCNWRPLRPVRAQRAAA